tara:strand:- start:273 stop:431 length:159 start_codon:yes stop_codon:yes gene_type:complete
MIIANKIDKKYENPKFNNVCAAYAEIVKRAPCAKLTMPEPLKTMTKPIANKE